MLHLQYEHNTKYYFDCFSRFSISKLTKFFFYHFALNGVIKIHNTCFDTVYCYLMQLHFQANQLF